VEGGEGHTRVAILGLGVVGRWVLGAIERDAHGLNLRIVAAADRGSGLVHRAGGLEVRELLAAKNGAGGLAELERVQRWPTAADGLPEIDFDVLVEVSQSPVDGEPGLTHIREALGRGIPVATSNKWPVAVAGTALLGLARENGTRLRAESTVMSATPVLSTLTEGISGATPVRLRGVVNATANFICSRVAAGETYERALEEAQRIGLAEPDPSADVDGYDSVSKLLVLAALIFGIQLRVTDIVPRGLSELRPEPGDRVREVTTLDPRDGRFTVEASPLSADDPLARVDGATNAIIAEVDPIGEITIAGPGAGPDIAGQGVYGDLLRLTGSAGAHR
jgi:homoserine dehydrogenase